MYRDNIDNAITYTQDDLALFRESPFAVWMERLTLENPEHGIHPDHDVSWPPRFDSHQASIAGTLRDEGRRVIEIDCDADETERRIATIAAMKAGVDFIVDGQLAANNLSDRVDLLMRTSGYSELGDFLYVPCETRAGDKSRLVYRLAFFADLLEMLQGQLPAQILIIRDNADVLSLQTEDHIHYYRAVFERFSAAMQEFRKHRMPDPAESCHFGRWAECASEVLKQRAAAEDARAQEEAEAFSQEKANAETLSACTMQVAAGAESMVGSEAAALSKVSTSLAEAGVEPVSTLAEQAKQFDPQRFKPSMAPGRAPNLAAMPVNRSADCSESAGSSGLSSELVPATPDYALENPELVESNRESSTPGIDAEPFASCNAAVNEDEMRMSQRQESTPEAQVAVTSDVPSASLGNVPPVAAPASGQRDARTEQAPESMFLPPDMLGTDVPDDRRQNSDEEQSPSKHPTFAPRSLVDSDDAPSSALAPRRPAASQRDRDYDNQKNETDSELPLSGDASGSPNGADEPVFDSRLNTSEEFD